MGFSSGSAVKNLPANAEDIRDLVGSLSWEDPLEEGITTYSSILAWRIPQTEEPGGLQPLGLQTVGHEEDQRIILNVVLFEKNHLITQAALYQNEHTS